MLAKCYRLLGGQEDSLVGDLERQQETLVADNKNESWMRSLPQLTETLKKASERAVLLRNAEDILGGLIIMPGSDDGRTVAVISETGLHLRRIKPDDGSAEAFLKRYREWIATTNCGRNQRLPHLVSDCLCVASRQMRQHSNQYRLMRREKHSGLSASDLLAFVFDGLNG